MGGGHKAPVHACAHAVLKPGRCPLTRQCALRKRPGEDDASLASLQGDISDPHQTSILGVWSTFGHGARHAATCPGASSHTPDLHAPTNMEVSPASPTSMSFISLLRCVPQGDHGHRAPSPSEFTAATAAADELTLVHVKRNSLLEPLATRWLAPAWKAPGSHTGPRAAREGSFNAWQRTPREKDIVPPARERQEDQHSSLLTDTSVWLCLWWAHRIPHSMLTGILAVVATALQRGSELMSGDALQSIGPL